jgi:glycosyltransferase involved in cell wall biosynthesis
LKGIVDLKITISHPHGNANSYQAAVALSEERWLSSFQTGLVRNPRAARLFRYLPADAAQRSLNRNYESIPEPNKRPHLLWEAVSRVGRRLKPAGLTSQVNWYDVLFCGHDLQVSRALEANLDAVYAYEDGAKWTFNIARQRDVAAVYELPLGYYKGVASEISRARKERPAFERGAYEEPHWKQARKNAELEIADVVVVPCAWAARSLSYNDGCGEKPVIIVPYGTPADEIPARTRRPDGPFTVLFAGQIGLRKGAPHLIEAWESLRLKDARLWMAGSMKLGRDYLADHSESFRYLGAIPRVRLLEVMREVDLFVFPSLAEGFGLVIGEAMAAGLPVLTTVNTGGPELIDDGREGWCIPAHDSEALRERIEWAYHNRDALYEMGGLARRKAERWTWADYRKRLIRELSRNLT